MKKSTKVLIIICAASLVLGIIFSIASLLALKNYGWNWIKENAEEDGIIWNISDWDDADFEDGNVHVRAPFVDVDVQDDVVNVSLPGFNVIIDDGKGRVVFGDPDDEEVSTDYGETVPTVTGTGPSTIFPVENGE